MKKNTTFHNLFQKIVSEEEIAVIQDAIGYKDSARKLDILTLIKYFLCAAMNEFKSYRNCADVGDQYGLPKVDHSTLSKKAGHVDFTIMKKLFHLVVSKWNRATRRALKISVETTGLVHDGPISEKLADSRFIMVEDRAYLKIKRIDQFVSNQQMFVIRMKENVEIFRPHALQRIEQEGSHVTRDITCQLGTKQSRSLKRHRVVFFKDDYGNEMRVVTNLMNVSPEVIADMYKARWKIETFFRWMKQNLNVPVLFGTTENAVFNQLFAVLIAYVLLKWVYSKTSQGRIFEQLSFTSFQRKLREDSLPIDWCSEMAVVLKKYKDFQWTGLPNFG